MKIYARSRLRTDRELDRSIRHTASVSTCVYPYMNNHIWTTIYGQPYMDNHIWSTIYGQPYMGTHIWTTIYGHPYMDYLYDHPYMVIIVYIWMLCAFMFGMVAIPRAFCKCVGGRPEKHGIQAALALVLQCVWPCPYRDAATIDVMPKMVLVLLLRPRFHHCHLHKTHNWFPHRHSQSLNLQSHQFVDCS